MGDRYWRWAAAALAFGMIGTAARGGEETVSADQIRGSVQKALALIEKSAAEYPNHRDCFSCHHQALPVLAMTVANDRGFPIDEPTLRKQLELTEADLKQASEAYRKGNGQGGGATRAGYALWALEQGAWKPDETTDAVVTFLLKRDANRDHWNSSSKRPPSEASPFTSTYVALRALRSYARPEQADAVKERTAKVRSWLESSQPADTEERVFRLLGLKLAGADDAIVADAVHVLRDAQRSDGGWAQLDDRESDAYATGSALVALHLAGGMSTSDPSYGRGLAYLLKTQLGNGSWHVTTRSRPFQTYFESGFPHGKDQFISMAASSWATTALALACPKK
jgi:N-acyl-D-amino-acid deacylase